MKNISQRKVVEGKPKRTHQLPAAETAGKLYLVGRFLHHVVYNIYRSILRVDVGWLRLGFLFVKVTKLTNFARTAYQKLFIELLPRFGPDLAHNHLIVGYVVAL